MNWKLMILAAVMVVAVLGLFAMEFGDGNGSRWDHDFVQIASGGSYSDGVLVLHSVPTTVFYSDRPDREPEYLTHEEFWALWSDTDDAGFVADPPIAALEVGFEDEPIALIALLGPPATLGQTLTYHVEILEGSIPESFESAILFIDAEGEGLSDDGET